MNVKAMEQLELIRSSGLFNMAEKQRIIRYAIDHDMWALADHAIDIEKIKNGGWLDILDEFSDYLEIISEFEAEKFEDKLND